MKRILTSIAILLAAVLTLQWTSQAKAQVYVSPSGSDSNNCGTPATACLTFAGAQERAGETSSISCVDAGNFGGLIITKSVTIDCLAGGGGFNLVQIVINAPGKTVRLRNLALNGISFSVALIDIVAASQVHIENVLVTSNSGGLPCIRDRRAGPAVLVVS